MGITKKSTDWLQPIELNEEETRIFLHGLKKPLTKDKLDQQKKLWEIAVKIGVCD